MYTQIGDRFCNMGGSPIPIRTHDHHKEYENNSSHFARSHAPGCLEHFVLQIEIEFPDRWRGVVVYGNIWLKKKKVCFPSAVAS